MSLLDKLKNAGNKLDGAGDKIVEKVNEKLSNIKAPTVKVEAGVSSNSIGLIAVMIVVIAILWKPIKRLFK